MTLGQCAYFAAQLDEAERAYRKAMDLLPTRPGIHSALGVVLLAEGKNEEALREINSESDVGEHDITLAGAYHLLGRISEAKTALAELEATYAKTNAYGIALNYAVRSNRDQAFEWLDRAFQRHEYLMEIKGNPWFNSLRGDPRYASLLRKLGLPN